MSHWRASSAESLSSVGGAAVRWKDRVRFHPGVRRYVGATRLNTPKNGWVLVTLMTAGLVVLIWAVAGPALSALFEQAIQRVSGL
ncbi:hypothetical protein SRABI98_00020 [Microbacterium sp. Bi98]|nr:hypothetical protein SRABI98_00020 [Microbacterium sp. Bi98]